MVRLDERGEGEWKIVATLAVVLYFFICGVRAIPPWTDDREFEARVKEILKYAGTQYMDREKMISEIRLKAEQLEIPIDPEDIDVLDEAKELIAKFSYSYDVDLILFQHHRDINIDVVQQKY